MSKIAPSILSADFSRLGEEVRTVSEAGADYLHIDVMDGHFVPNISFGAAVMKSLDTLNLAPYDVHLMIENPDQYISDFVTENTDFITVHQEACTHLHRTLEHIRSFGVGTGVAVNPATPLSSLACVAQDVDLILVMTVDPGFGGQALIPSALSKVEELKRIREERGWHFQIEVDGGITAGNAAQAARAGADILVAGSAVFHEEDAAQAVRELKQASEK